MLVEFGNRIVNTDHIVTAEKAARTGGTRQITATLTTGETITFGGDAAIALGALCGTVVPAPPGLVLIEAFVPTKDQPGSKVNYWETAVIAFRVLGGVQSPLPIGLRGEPQEKAGSEYAVIQADGRCVGWEQIWPDREAFVAHCEKLAAQNRASLASRTPPSQSVSPPPPAPASAKPAPVVELRTRIMAEPIQAPFADAPWRPGRDLSEVIDEVRRGNPNLHASGVGYSPTWGWKWGADDLGKARSEMTKPGHVEEFERALRFLSHAGRQFAQKALNRKRTSYSWKHAAERVMGGYVSNGMLITAAYALGFKVEVNQDSPNVCINLSEGAVELDPERGM